MNYKTALALHETFVLTKDFEITLGNAVLQDSMAKGYVYANLFFYDEVQKEVKKLRALVKKLHKDVIKELAMCKNDPPKLLLEMSTRAHRKIGDDGLDAIIKEHLAETRKHVSLMVDQRERAKFMQICEAIFMEITDTFYKKTLHIATDLVNNMKMFKFTPEYVQAMTERQRTFVAPALRVIGLEHQIKLNNLQISENFTVRYSPELAETPFLKQEETIKDQLKTFIQTHS